MLIEAVVGQIGLRRDAQSEPLRLVPLDGGGRPQPSRAAAPCPDGGRAIYELNSADGTAWYVLSAREP